MENESGDSKDFCICDQKFIDDLARLKRLRDFLMQEAVVIPPEESCFMSFGELNLLKIGSDGRAPTEKEWTELEDRTQMLFGKLTEPLRRRFLLGEIPSWVTMLSIYMALFALVALLGAILIFWSHNLNMDSMSARVLALPFYLLWLMALGAIGSIAFIGMNALSVQQDVTFDLSNHRLMILRISLGALFGLVLALPFGFNQFIQFLSGIIVSSKPLDPRDSQTLSLQAMMLLLPFVLGFSTPLVIMILNRFVDAIQAFFGQGGTNTSAPPTAPPSPVASNRVLPKHALEHF
jgi:hypothetical protein